MRPMITYLSAGLAIAGAFPAVAAPGLGPANRAMYVAVADSDFARKKDEYVQDAKREMQEWGDKIEHAGGHAERDVNRAWNKTKEAAQRLQTASGDRWDRAKQGFENAMQDLKDRWHKVHPEDE